MARRGARDDIQGKADAWFTFHIGDYLGDTMGLTTRQHGAYLLLLMALYRSGGALQQDEAELRLITRLSPAEWAEDWPRLSRYFHDQDGALHQRRVDRELARTGAAAVRRSAAAAAGARGRWNRDRATGMPIASESSLSEMPIAFETGGVSDANRMQPQPQPQPQPEQQGSSGESESGAVLGAGGTDAAARAAEDVSGLIGWIAETCKSPNMLRFGDEVRRWYAMGADEVLIRDVLGAVCARNRMRNASWTPTKLTYFGDAIADAIAQRREHDAQTTAIVDAAARTWDPRLKQYRRSGYWSDDWDGKPDGDHPNPAIPAALLAKHGYRKEA